MCVFELFLLSNLRVVYGQIVHFFSPKKPDDHDKIARVNTLIVVLAHHYGQDTAQKVGSASPS